MTLSRLPLAGKRPYGGRSANHVYKEPPERRWLLGQFCRGLNRTTSADYVSPSRRKKLLAMLVLHNLRRPVALLQDIVLVSAGCLLQGCNLSCTLPAAPQSPSRRHARMFPKCIVWTTFSYPTSLVCGRSRTNVCTFSRSLLTCGCISHWPGLITLELRVIS